MRGRTKAQASMLAFVDPETLIPADHPLRTIKHFADAALAELSPLFDQVYAADGQGRPSIPPERLLKASLLISLYSVRSERVFCEELTYHLLFRWVLDMDLVEPSFDHSTFTKNRARLLRHRVSRQFFEEIVRQADRVQLLSDEHFTVDGTLIEAAASFKSFRPKDEPPPPAPGHPGRVPPRTHRSVRAHGAPARWHLTDEHRTRAPRRPARAPRAFAETYPRPVEIHDAAIAAAYDSQ
jgi:transposase